MRAWISGGSGFVGRHLVEAFDDVCAPRSQDAARLIARIAEGGRRGVFHCSGGESVTRRELALRTVEVFGLDGDLLEFGPAPEQPWPVPFDTRLDATATAAALGVELPDLDDQLRRLERSLSCTT